jgi:hypothetical protein
VPMFAVTFSRWLLDEPVTPALVVGAIILVGGVWLINRRQMSGRQGDKGTGGQGDGAVGALFEVGGWGTDVKRDA